MFDEDGNGFIDLKELKNAMSGLKLTDQEWKDLINQYDSDNDGVVSEKIFWVFLFFSEKLKFSIFPFFWFFLTDFFFRFLAMNSNTCCAIFLMNNNFNYLPIINLINISLPLIFFFSIRRKKIFFSLKNRI